MWMVQSIWLTIRLTVSELIIKDLPVWGCEIRHSAVCLCMAYGMEPGLFRKPEEHKRMRYVMLDL